MTLLHSLGHMSSSFSEASSFRQWKEDLHHQEEFSFVSSLGDPLEVQALDVEAGKDETQGICGESGSSGTVSTPPVAFTKRFVMFSDHMTAGAFISSNSDLPRKPDRFILLSPNGEFCHISSGRYQQTHLTRYVPSQVGKEVAELLLFRNRMTPTPYLCKRFNHVDRADIIPGDGVVRFSVHDRERAEVRDACGSNVIGQRGLGHIIVSTLDVLFHDDELSDVKSNPPPHPPLVTTISTYYPVAKAPIELINIFEYASKQLDSNNTRGYFGSLDMPRVGKCAAKESKEALTLFAQLAPELALLKDSNYFPSAFLVVAECIDDEVVYCQCNSSLKDEKNTEVEAWMLHEAFPKNCAEWDVHAIITLHKEVFTIKDRTQKNSGTVTTSDAHISLINLAISNTASVDVDEPPPFNDVAVPFSRPFSENGEQIPILKYVHQASHLVSLQQHIKEYYAKYGVPGVKEGSGNEHSTRGYVESPRRNDIIQFVRKADGARFSCFVDDKVVGRFADRCIVEIFPDPKQLVRVTLPNGTIGMYSLAKCIQLGSAASDSSHTLAPLTNDITVLDRTILGHYVADCPQPDVETLGYSKNVETPSISTAQHVVSLLAFRHWAMMPPSHRASEENRARMLVQRARGEMDRSNRFLITTAMESGDKKLSLRDAVVLSDRQHASICMDLNPTQYDYVRANEVSTLANTNFYNEAQHKALKVSEESNLHSPDSVASTLTNDEGSTRSPSIAENHNKYNEYESPALAKLGMYKKIDQILDRNRQFLEELNASTYSK